MIPAPTPPAGRRGVRAAVAAVLILAGVWAGLRVYLATRPDRASHATVASAVRVPAGEASPPTDSDLGDVEAVPPAAVKIPERLPEFALQDPLGNVKPISTWAGQSLVLNFWATWCAPCRREIPLLQSLQTRWHAHAVTVVGVAVDHRDAVLAYAAQFKIAYPLLVGEQDALDVAARLGMESPVFPFTVFTDRRGEVVALYVGELHSAQADLILSVVQNLNDDRVELPAARRSIAAGLQTLARGAT